MTDYLEDLGDGRMREQPCPNCGSPLSGATPAAIELAPGEDLPDEPPRPEVGDLTMCAYCTACLRYGPAGVLQLEPNVPPEYRQFIDPMRVALRKRHH